MQQSRVINLDSDPIVNMYESTKEFENQFFSSSHLKKLIDQYKIISFDVFDTLLIRKFAKPIDVFYYIEHNLKLPNFAAKRIGAEAKARKIAYSKFGSYEVTLDEIYQILNNEAAKQEELRIEKIVCIKNYQLYSIYNYCIHQEKKVIAASDMYLSKQYITELLHKEKYSYFDHIFVSSEARRCKGSGKMFGEIMQTLSCSNTDILHIGDNKNSDYLVPQKLGIKSYLYTTVNDQFKKCSGINKEFFNKLKSSNDSTFSMLLSKFIHEWILDDKKEKSFWYDFGYFYTGPLSYGFIQWLLKKCKKDKIKKIYFLARDGLLMQKVFDQFNSDIESHYLLASRRLFYIATLKKLDQKSLKMLTSVAPGTKAYETINRLGIKNDLIDRTFLNYFSYNDVLDSMDKKKKLICFFEEIEPELLKIASQERIALLKYLEEMGLNDESNMALVDIGWAASSQRCIEELLKKSFYGYYIGLLKHAYNNKTYGYAFNFNSQSRANIFLQSLEIVELMFSGTHPSAAYLRNEGNETKVVYNELVDKEIERLSIAEDIHKGCLEFTKSFHHFIQGFKVNINLDWALCGTESLLFTPNDEEIEKIGAIHHAQYMGNSSYSQIIPSSNSSIKQIYNLLKNQASHTAWEVGFKKKYIKSYNFLIIEKIIKVYRYYRYNGLIALLQLLINKLKRY